MVVKRIYSGKEIRFINLTCVRYVNDLPPPIPRSPPYSQQPTLPPPPPDLLDGDGSDLPLDLCIGLVTVEAGDLRYPVQVEGVTELLH